CVGNRAMSGNFCINKLQNRYRGIGVKLGFWCGVGGLLGHFDLVQAGGHVGHRVGGVGAGGEILRVDRLGIGEREREGVGGGQDVGEGGIEEGDKGVASRECRVSRNRRG